MNKKSLGRAYKKMMRATPEPRVLKSVHAVELVVRRKSIPILRMLILQDRFVDNLQLPEESEKKRAELVKLSRKITEHTSRLPVCGSRSPVSVAGASIYLACERLKIGLRAVGTLFDSGHY